MWSPASSNAALGHFIIFQISDLVFQFSAPEVFPYVLNYGTAWLSDIR